MSERCISERHTISARSALTLTLIGGLHEKQVRVKVGDEVGPSLIGPLIPTLHMCCDHPFLSAAVAMSANIDTSGIALRCPRAIVAVVNEQHLQVELGLGMPATR